MGRYSTPTGDKLKTLIRKIDRWLLKQEDESTIDWAYQATVGQFEELYASMLEIDRTRAEADRLEREERKG